MNISQFQHNRPDKPFHSSGYAHVARGNAMGSMNAQSFGQRNDMERSRSSVNRYGDSMVGQAYVHRGTQPSGANSMPARPTSALSSPQYARRTSTVRSQPRSTFREPPTRYNPYS